MAKRVVKRGLKQGAKISKSASMRESKRKLAQEEGQPKALVPHRFKKGNPGKKPGTKNKLGRHLKECILEAAEKSGRDGKGKDGTVGYLVWLSRAEPAVYGRMLEKIMPLQVDVRDKSDKNMSADEAVERLEERGLPVPPALRQLAEGIARDRAENDDHAYDAELNGEGYEGAGEDDVFSGDAETVDGDDDQDEPDDGSSGSAVAA